MSEIRPAPVATDQLDFNLRKCSLTATRPWQKHCIGAPNIQASYLYWLILNVDVRRPNQQWKWPEWIILSPDEISRLTHLLQYNEHPVWEGADTICKTFEQIATIVRNGDSSMRLSTLTLLVNQLLLELLELIEQNPKVDDPTLTSTRRSVALFLEGLRIVSDTIRILLQGHYKYDTAEISDGMSPANGQDTAGSGQ